MRIRGGSLTGLGMRCRGDGVWSGVISLEAWTVALKNPRSPTAWLRNSIVAHERTAAR